jgi:Skp family chaperone for outer membrane proteins
MMLVAGLAALGAGIYVSKLWAQQPAAPAPAPLQTRIAIMNINYVIKGYNKYLAFQAEIKEAVKPYQEKDAAKKKLAENLAKEMQNPQTAAPQRENLEKQLKGLQREIEDNKAEANAFLNKKSDEQLKILYMDVHDAATRYAMAHNFEAVLTYNDATTQEEYFSPMNIARKLQTPGCMPLYAAAGLDISQEVTKALNAAYGRTAPAAPAAGGAAPR